MPFFILHNYIINMGKHKSEDYKISAVQYYNDNNSSYVETCKIFKCSEKKFEKM